MVRFLIGQLKFVRFQNFWNLFTFPFNYDALDKLWKSSDKQPDKLIKISNKLASTFQHRIHPTCTFETKILKLFFSGWAYMRADRGWKTGPSQKIFIKFVHKNAIKLISIRLFPIQKVQLIGPSLWTFPLDFELVCINVLTF